MRDAIAWTAARAPLMVVTQGIRQVMAARRMACSSVKEVPPVVV